MQKKLFIPFDRNGNLLDYSYRGITEEEKENERVEHFWGDGSLIEVFVPNFEFEDTLLFERFSRGRSSVKAHFVSCSTSKKYEMFISDLEDVIKANCLINGKINGKFTFAKKGQNYGVKLLKGERYEIDG